MTSLPEISTELATYFALASGALGTGIASTAAQRITDGTIDAGQGFFRRLFRIGGEDAPITPPEDLDAQRADQLLGALSAEDRRRLAVALVAWRAEHPDGPLDAARLVKLMTDPDSGDTYNVAAHGPNSVAVGSVGDGATFNVGGSRQRDEE
ncbi:hypothetical protein [Streptomyces smaragdinus]|uniref:hypothetical protein n=1 Tax=Streptomyces smaragdinus TaxID=2585196 RepID=UPI002B1F17AB|nr:hypothetical protein [Streptomyces smaragdinus]